MSSSSSDDRSHEGGVRLCPPPRRQASAVTVRQPSATVEAAPPAPVKSSSHKPPQAMQAKAPDSPTPLPKSQRSAAKTTAQPNPYYYPASMIRHGYPAMMAPIAPSYGIPSETSASTGYFPVRHPSTAYGTYISPQGGHHMVLASSSSAPTSSIDSITTGFSGMKLALQYQDEANKYIRHVQEQIYELIQTTYRQSNVPSRFKEEIDGSLRNLVSDLGNLSGFVDRLAAEADSAKNQDNERQQIQATAGMQAVEIERLRNQVETLRLRLSGAEKNNEEVQKTYQDVLASKKEQSEMLQEKLKQCQEQLEGKRHVFYTAHDDVEGKARILSIAADNDYREKAKIIQSLIDSEPEDKLKIIDILFATNAKAPVHSRSVSYQPTMMAIQSGSTPPTSDLAWPSRPPSRVTPPALASRRTPSVMHSGSIARPPSVHPGSSRFSHPKSRTSTGHHSTRHDPGSVRYRFDEPSPVMSAQEFGSPQPSQARQLVLAQSQQEWNSQIEIWKEEFYKVFRLIHGWAAQYAKLVQPGQASVLPTQAPRLWEFMSDILYPGQPEAGASHAAFLLADEQCRSYFVERLLLQYVVNNILSVEGWMGFTDQTDQELKELNDRLRSTEVFKSYIRQSIIDQISTVIGRMLADPAFPEYRARRISFHQQRLKTIVGPLMDPEASRTDAGFDLHAVASTALQTSALMFQSRLNFEFSWSDTCSKFSVDYHIPLEPPMDPLMLQQKQYRIKLTVTPTILFRDDRGVSTNQKRVLRSEVFVMN